MATIWKSKGTVGEGSTDGGTDMPLDVIDERLRNFKLFYQGESPRSILPQSRYYEYTLLSVTDVAEPRRPERLSHPGFYQVIGLRVNDAGFLLEPYVFIPFDALAKALVADLPVDARVNRDPVANHMTVEVRFRDQLDRNNIKHSKVVESAHDNEEFVKRIVGEFFTMNGIARRV